ncbi:MAG: PilZ domain-containing protein [Acidobacteria bacterium]|nr:PilZ domain-containing protein [Acidobacteriota bacterium]
MSEHRTGRRFPVNLPIELEVDQSAKKHKGSTRDLSASGVYITAAAPFRVGSSVKFQISVPGALVGAKQDVDIECEGHVVRVDKKGGKNEAGNSKTDPAPDGVACVIDNYKFVRVRAAAAGKKAGQ